MKQGFTLAEVLITLGIIGVVAALTLPSLVQNYREQAMVTRVKKFYSVFSQAYAMAVQENGTMDNWGLKDSVTVEDEDGERVHSDETLQQYDKFFNIIGKYLQKAGYEPIHNTAGKNGYQNKGYIMSDGTAIVGMWLLPSQCTEDNPDANCGNLYVHVDNKPTHDKNGNWNPNVFCFGFNPNRIYPLGTNNSQFKNYCLNGKGYHYCTGWVIMNGNMDYLHCDDLSINGKTKCR